MNLKKVTFTHNGKTYNDYNSYHMVSWARDHTTGWCLARAQGEGSSWEEALGNFEHSFQPTHSKQQEDTHLIRRHIWGSSEEFSPLK